MKYIEDMTLREIKSAKERYSKEFRELINDFMESHPNIDSIFIKSKIGNMTIFSGSKIEVPANRVTLQSETKWML